MSIIGTVDLPQTGGESDPKQKTKNNTRDRLHKWYVEHGKAKRAQKRIRSSESNDLEAEDYASDESDDYPPPKRLCRPFTNEQIEFIKRLIAEQNMNPLKSVAAVASAGVCALGAFGIGRAALQNKESVMNLANSFLAQLADSPPEPAIPSSDLSSEPPLSTPAPSSSATVAENVDL